MKKISTLLIIIATLFTLSCEKENFSNPEFSSSELFVYNWLTAGIVPVNEELEIDPMISPVQGTDISWYLNGTLVEEATNQPSFTYQRPEKREDDVLKLVVKRGEITREYTMTLSLRVDFFLPKEYQHKVVGFIASDATDKDIDWANLTHLIVSSAVVGASGAVEAPSLEKINLSNLIETAKKEGVYVLLSVSDNIDPVTGRGPWGNANFIQAIETKEDELIANIVAELENNKYYGVNIDCNLTNPMITEEQALKVKAFVAKLHEALPDKDGGGKMLLSMNAFPVWNDNVIQSWATISEVDWFNLVAYGFDDIVSHHHARYDATFTSGANKWLGYGVPKEKLVLGIPAYGVRYDWPTDGTAVGWSNASLYTSHVSYKNIVNAHSGAEVSTKNHGDYSSGYIDEASGIFFDSLISAEEKANAVITNQWGGVAVYSVEQDTHDEKSLTKKLYQVLNNQ